MKGFFISTLIAVLACAFAMPVGVPSKLRKAFEALEVYNYFAAKEGFEKSLTKDPVPASFGLSIIYSRQDNPFSDLDSAVKYIYRAALAYPDLQEQQVMDYVEIGVDSIRIDQQLEQVDSLALLRALHAGQLDALQQYIDQHHTARFVVLAERERDAMAFQEATAVDDAQAYAAFLEVYPDAQEHGLAKERYALRLFEEATNSGYIRDFQGFVEDHPDSPYRKDAEYAVYNKSTRAGTPAVCVQFIQENPNNPFVDDAWRKLYALEIGDSSPRSIAAFTLKYPNYPFLNELKSDFDLATTRIYPIRQDDQWGFVDENGVVRIAPTFEWTEPFSEALALVSAGEDGAVYINKQGKAVTTKPIEDGLPFLRGHAVVDVDGKQGVINRLGQWVVKPEYDACGDISEGFFYAESNGSFGYLNRFGDVVIPFEYSEASNFVNGRAIVARDSFGYIDSLGNAIGSFIFDWLEPFGKNGVARYRKDGKFGLIKSTGDTLTGAIYHALGDLHEGHYLAANEQLYGFVSSNGDTAIAFKYAYSQTALTESFFENGHAKVFQKVNKETMVGVIDTLDKKVVPAIFNAMGRYTDGLIAVRKQDLWGYADQEMNLRIKYKYDEAGTFVDNTAIVVLKGRYGLIDSEGNALIAPQFNQVQRLDSILLAADSLFGLFSLLGDTLLPPEFAEAAVVDDHVIRFTDKAELFSYFDYRQMRFIWREDSALD
jgi:hypothetical protein